MIIALARAKQIVTWGSTYLPRNRHWLFIQQKATHFVTILNMVASPRPIGKNRLRHDNSCQRQETPAPVRTPFLSSTCTIFPCHIYHSSISASQAPPPIGPHDARDLEWSKPGEDRQSHYGDLSRCCGQIDPTLRGPGTLPREVIIRSRGVHADGKRKISDCALPVVGHFVRWEILQLFPLKY